MSELPQGVVRPPPEIRTIVERTAGYVARNGVLFENRIRDKEAQNPKFSFLKPEDAYHPFYQWRLDEVRAGRGTAMAAGRAGEVTAAPVQAPPRGPPKPSDFLFCARMPRISQKDLDTLRLTASFVAKNGTPWLQKLKQREAHNPQFQFLQPQHTLHTYFQRMVDQYTLLLRASQPGEVQRERLAELQKNLDDRFHVLERARQRSAYDRFQEAERKAKAAKQAREKEELAKIDWGDFVVVETITFTDADAKITLPPPTRLADLQYASLEDRTKVSMSNTLRIEEAMPTEDDLNHNYYNVSEPVGGVPASSQTPEPSVASPSSSTATTTTTQSPANASKLPPKPVGKIPPGPTSPPASVSNTASLSATQPLPVAPAAVAPTTIKIKENYVPRASQRNAHKPAQAMALCPNCKQMIGVAELDEHMRIELLDPQWREQKAKADARLASRSVAGVHVAQNLKRLSSQRNDALGLSDDEIHKKPKVTVNLPAAPLPGQFPPVGPLPTGVPGLPRPPPPPGTSAAPSVAPGPPPGVNVDEQIRSIHQKYSSKKA